jgi:hypothetical protein
VTLPNFVILGAAKAGTTALYHYLTQHPEIYMTPTKETNFFSLMDDRLDFRGPGDQDYISRFSITAMEEYRAQFRGRTTETAVGEASPLYLYCPQAPPRIHEYLPDAKLVAILRNPVARAYSAFLHLVRDGRETTVEFGSALREEEARIRDRWEHIWHYKRMGFYHEQVKRYYDLFDREQIRLYTYRRFTSEPLSVLQDLFRFLGVDDTFAPDLTVRHNSASIPAHLRPPLLLDVWTELQQAYREDVLRLQDLTGLDVSHWLTDAPYRSNTS